MLGEVVVSFSDSADSSGNGAEVTIVSAGAAGISALVGAGAEVTETADCGWLGAGVGGRSRRERGDNYIPDKT